MKALFLACALLIGHAHAQEPYPSKPLRLILPFPPGGGTDILGRLLADRLAANLGQPVVTENRGGAGGNVGAEAAARSAPDGYTIVLVAPSLAISPTLYSKLNYDPVKDFAPIGLVASVPNVMITHPPVPNKWFTDNKLEILDSNILNEDPDGDGFTNLEEWQNRNGVPGQFTLAHFVFQPPTLNLSGDDRCAEEKTNDKAQRENRIAT